VSKKKKGSGKKSGARKGKAKKSGKSKSRRRPYRSHFLGLPLPTLDDVKVGGAAIVGRVVDKAVYALPERLHPWAASAFAAAVPLAKKSIGAELARFAYRVQLIHIAETTPQDDPAVEKIARKVREFLGARSRGRDAGYVETAGSGSGAPQLTKEEQDIVAGMFQGMNWPGKPGTLTEALRQAPAGAVPR
jgi:hypothetical protein